MIIYEPIYRNISGNIDAAAAIDTESLGEDQKYICWFEGQQSVNLWYYKRLIIRPHEDEVTVKVSENSIYRIYDPSAASGDFIDNKKILKTEVTLSKDLELDEPLSDYIFIYIVGYAEEPGEFVDFITINGEKVYLGMEVYDENETLRINTQNMGTGVSDDIVRAIYETDIYEERPNWIVLNNKWKELLVNFMDVMGCKGNYKSLKNSLEWFNYGRLVELREVWANTTAQFTNFMDRPLNKWLTNWYKKSLGGLIKTTYFVLRQCSVDLEKQIGTEIVNKKYPNNTAYRVPVYQPYTYDPERIKENDLTETEIKWAKDEMRMKMQLMSMYFEQNFMPIHLDIIRASVEDLYFDVPGTIHMAGAAELETYDFVGNDTMDIYSNGKDNEPDEDDYDVVLHLDQQSVYGADFEFNQHSSPRIKSRLNFGITNVTQALPPILGVTYDAPPSYPESTEESQGIRRDNMAIISASWFNEIGAVAEFEIATKKLVNHGSITTNIISPEITRNSDIECELCSYNVDWDGKIINHDQAYEDAIEWAPGMTYYKQILSDQYCIVNQYGLPATLDRYPEPEPGWVLWDEDVEWNDTLTYYKQTTTATYVMVNGRGQQISDERLKVKPTNAIEWNVGLRYKRDFYKTIIRLLCQQPGEFWVLLTLTGPSANYTRKLNIKVIDNLNISLEFFKLKYNNDFTGNPFGIENLGPNKNMFVTTRDPDTNPNIYKEQGWVTKNTGSAGIKYELPAKVIKDYTYSQFLNLSTYGSSQEFYDLLDKPRTSWVATVYPNLNESESVFVNSNTNNIIDSELCPSEMIGTNRRHIEILATNGEFEDVYLTGLGIDGAYCPSEDNILDDDRKFVTSVHTLLMDAQNENLINPSLWMYNGYITDPYDPNPTANEDVGSDSEDEPEVFPFDWVPKYIPASHKLVRKIRKTFSSQDSDDYVADYYCECDNNGTPILRYTIEVPDNATASWIPTPREVYDDRGVRVGTSSLPLIRWRHNMTFKNKETTTITSHGVTTTYVKWVIYNRHLIKIGEYPGDSTAAAVQQAINLTDYFKQTGTLTDGSPKFEPKYTWAFYRVDDETNFYIVDNEWGGLIFKYVNQNELQKNVNIRTYSQWAPGVILYEESTGIMDDPYYVKGMSREEYLALESIEYNGNEYYIKRGYIHSPRETEGRLSDIYNDENIVLGKIKYLQFINKNQIKSSREDLMALLENNRYTGNSYIYDVKQTYIPEYHIMERIIPDANNMDIPDTYPIVAVPVIELDIDGKRKDLTWSHRLESPAWDFFSFALVSQAANLKFNVQQPFVASENKNKMPIGRYKVSFKYKWGNEEKTTSRMSPFNIIHED